MKIPLRQIESGTALVVVMSILATLLVLVGVSFEYTQTINRHVQRSDTLENAVSIGDGAIDLMFGYWREACRKQTNVALTTNQLAANGVIPLPTGGSSGTLFPDVPNFTATRNADTSKTISNYKIVAVDPQLVQMSDDSTPPTPGVGQQPTNATFNYIASVDVTLPTMRGDITTQIRRVFQKEQVSPWAFAIFYVDPLEIHPGPLFKITGPVHTNSDLYAAHNSLQFFDKVTYGGKWYNKYMPGDCRTDTPTPPLFVLAPPDIAPAKQPFGLDSSRIFNSGDTNPNNDSYHELIDIPVINPATGVRYSDPLQDQRYYDQAGIKILIDNSGNLTVMRQDGTVVSAASPAGSSDRKLYNAITATGVLTTGEQIYDNREVLPPGKVRLTTLHVDQLLAKVNDPTNGIPSNRWNGVVYITDTSYTPSTRRGIRLKGGNVLPNGGLTVASANPVYIQGDYNTGSGVVPSNNGDPLNPTVPTYDKSSRPSSVIADAVNILSNAWVDTNANNSAASNTTVNTAIVSGIVPTANCHYSGGAENFPRFLENWDTKTFTYYGSMVELYNSKQAVGTWDTAVYTPPLRQWYFDTDFNTHTPPGTLMLYNYIKSRWFMP
jgi:hypothetical protein